MAANATICESGALVERGPGVRFVVRRVGQAWPAFAIRHDGVVQGFVNRCAHRGVELDWEHGRFFDVENRFLICATHGALYEADSGFCVAGPCLGGRLTKVPIVERDGKVSLVSDDGWELVVSEDT